MSFFDNKRGQSMSTSTIILLILGLVVLVVLILGFTMGWQKIAPFLSNTNVNDVVTTCQASCVTGDKFGFCSSLKVVNDGVNDKFEATCFDLATNSSFVSRNYGVSECSSITCN